MIIAHLDMPLLAGVWVEPDPAHGGGEHG
jgi:hypothetical protein